MQISSVTADVKVNVSGKESLVGLEKSLKNVGSSLEKILGKPNGKQEDKNSPLNTFSKNLKDLNQPSQRLSGTLGDIAASLGRITIGAGSLLAVGTMLGKMTLGDTQTLEKYKLQTGNANIEDLQRLQRMTSQQGVPLANEQATKALLSINKFLYQLEIGQVQQLPRIAQLSGLSPADSLLEGLAKVLQTSKEMGQRGEPQRIIAGQLQEAGLPVELLQLDADTFKKDLQNFKPAITEEKQQQLLQTSKTWNSFKDNVKSFFKRMWYDDDMNPFSNIGRAMMEDEDMYANIKRTGGNNPFTVNGRSLLEPNTAQAANMATAANTERTSGENNTNVTQNNYVQIDSSAPAEELRTVFERQSVDQLQEINLQSVPLR